MQLANVSLDHETTATVAPITLKCIMESAIVQIICENMFVHS